MMVAYDARRLTEQAFDTERSSDRRLRIGEPTTLQGRYFIQFVAQILRAEIRAILREKDRDSRYTEEGLLATLSTMNVLEYGGGGERYIGDHTERQKDPGALRC